MNLILLPQLVSRAKWNNPDVRFKHLSDVLRVQPGSVIDFAVENGPRGKGKIESISSVEVEVSFQWEQTIEANFLPVRLLIGLSRPQTCRKILEQAAAMGVEEFHFFGADKGESSYASSTLWTSDEWKKKIRGGVEQAFSTHLPKCKIYENLSSVLKETETASGFRIGLDNYEATGGLTPITLQPEEQVWVAIGPERGWSPDERNLLRDNLFELRHLGKRVLRVETAVVAAVGILGINSLSKD